MRNILFATVASFAIAAAATPAHAAFSFTDSAFYTAPSDGTLTFTFEGHSAADTDVMKFVFSGMPIFTNHDALGTTLSVHVTAGSTYQLQMVDLSVANTWSSDPALNSDGKAHLAFTDGAGFGQFHLGAAPVVPVDESACAQAGGCYLGWEDRRFPAADADFNDLVFAEVFTAAPVPEPLSLSLLGVGLLGLGMVRRSR